MRAKIECKNVLWFKKKCTEKALLKMLKKERNELRWPTKKAKMWAKIDCKNGLWWSEKHPKTPLHLVFKN